MLTLGIDPGPVNTGIAIVREATVVLTNVVNIKGKNINDAAQIILNIAKQFDVNKTAIERFASYGANVSITEPICYFIGSLCAVLPDAYLVRAIDWKTQVAQALYIQGFRNPSMKLDKKFSLAAAEFLFSAQFRTDHEADAALLAFWRALPAAKNTLTV